jgi:hypothetical protein
MNRKNPTARKQQYEEEKLNYSHRANIPQAALRLQSLRSLRSGTGGMRKWENGKTGKWENGEMGECSKPLSFGEGLG